MSFLPFEGSTPRSWRLAMGTSVVAHLGLGVLLLFGAVPFLPQSGELSAVEEEFALVSIDVLDAVQVLEPENDQVESEQPEDPLTPLGGAEIPAEDPDLTALAPDDTLTAPEPEELPETLLQDTALPTEVPEALDAELQEDVPAEAVESELEPEFAETSEEDSVPEEIVGSVSEAIPPEEALPVEEPVVSEIAPFVEDSFSVEDNTFDLAEDSPLEGEGAGGFGADLDLAPDEVSLPSEDAPEAPDHVSDEEAVALALLAPQEAGRTDESGDLFGESEDQGEQNDPATDESQDAPQLRTARRIVAPSVQMRGLGQLIRQIRAVPQPQCSLLLPRRSQRAGLGLSMVGTDDIALNAVADRVVARVEGAVQRNVEIIDLRQCAALDALRQSAAYPASRLGLTMEQRTLNSGDRLRARVIGAGGLNLALLLVDDNGVVQDLSRFATLDGDAVAVDAPVARAGAVRNTRQILFVLGHENESFNLEAEMGKTAQDVFSSLGGDILEGTVFAMTTFQVLQ